MTAQLLPVPVPNVTVVDGVFHLREVKSSDPDLLALVDGARDAEAVLQRVLSTGARALVIAQATVDTAVVEKSFDVLERQLRSMLDDTAARVHGSTAEVLDDPERGLAATLGSWKADISALLARTFDPQYTDSAFGKLDSVLR